MDKEHVTSVKDIYFHYLGNLMGANSDYYPNKYYWILLHKLFSMSFYTENALDKNRIYDGEKLRDKWIEVEAELGHEYFPSQLDFPCSVLEVMIGLSLRIEEDVMQDPDRGDRTRFWFWQMIHNLGFDDFDDRNITESKLDEIYVRVHNMLERNYDKFGHGSLWPVEHPREDMREIDIWYQMHEFLRENKERFS